MKKIYFLIFSGIVILIFFNFSCQDKQNTFSGKYKNKDLKLSEKSIDTITSVLLEIVSGKAGEKRDWSRFENLFKPYAILTTVSLKGKQYMAKNYSVKEFIDIANMNSLKTDFTESEFSEKIVVFGNIAHVFQVYVSNTGASGQNIRGVNSYQLVFDQERWWIVSVTWQVETEKFRIPPELLGTDKRVILPS